MKLTLIAGALAALMAVAGCRSIVSLISRAQSA